jgi:hypothetical protein
MCSVDALRLTTDVWSWVANMQVITAVYLNCRPDLRDEWLTGIEVDDVSDSQVRLLRGFSIALSEWVLSGARTSSETPRQVL